VTQTRRPSLNLALTKSANRTVILLGLVVIGMIIVGAAFLSLVTEGL
jgi:hypothetical protein